jgi:Cd2+/Zn2+-exporting ATPase
VGAYAEGVAVMLFFKIGELLQESAVNKSRRSISALLALRPDVASVKRNEAFEQVDPATVRQGEIIQVKPGERVPLDGDVLDGSSHMDTSALTGESVPRRVGPGDGVLSGMINTSGLLTVRVLKPLAESTVSRILDYVENAAAKKAPTEQFITRFAKVYTPAVVFAALCIATLPVLMYSVPALQSLYDAPPSWSQWIYQGLIFLVISCPCALVISIPLGFFGGIGAASRQGILVKGANYLEGLNRIAALVWDKTGTLTQGVFEVTAVHSADGFSREEILHTAALAEAYSSHPIAGSIRKAFPGELDLGSIASYEEHSGRGVEASISGRSVLAGNELLLRERGIEAPDLSLEGSLIHVAVDGAYAGSIAISDRIKEGSARTVTELRQRGLRNQYMLSGDTHRASRAVGDRLKLSGVFAELLPEDKVTTFEEILARHKANGLVAYVGDGINDAPVLSRADIGVAMGGLGSDAAIEAADVVLMEDRPEKLLKALDVAGRTRLIVWQNILLALGIKGCILLLGTMGLATMWEAVFADVGTALLAILNSLRVLR